MGGRTVTGPEGLRVGLAGGGFSDGLRGDMETGRPSCAQAQSKQLSGGVGRRTQGGQGWEGRDRAEGEPRPGLKTQSLQAKTEPEGQIQGGERDFPGKRPKTRGSEGVQNLLA